MKPMKSRRPRVPTGLGRMLRLLRERESLSQQEVADKVGIARTTICVIERSYVYPSAETLVAVADALGYEVLVHFRRKGPPKVSGPPHRDPHTLLQQMRIEGVSNHGSNQGLEEPFCIGQNQG